MARSASRHRKKLLAQAVKKAAQEAAASPGGLQASRSAVELRKPLLRPLSGARKAIFDEILRCGVESAAARRGFRAQKCVLKRPTAAKASARQGARGLELSETGLKLEPTTGRCCVPTFSCHASYLIAFLSRKLALAS